jgi:iron complex outermembrane receptor protein
MKQKNRIAIAAALSAGIAGTALAATPPTVETVTVTATRVTKAMNDIPAAVDIVSKDDVQLARPQIGIDESLAQVPGVFLQDRYNFAQDTRISIRGFGARANFGIRGVRIFVDGIPETLPDGQGQVDSVDLGSVEQISVLKGSASALYGNASGGVILIDSELPPEVPMVEARSSYGEFGLAKNQLKFAGTAGKLGFMANASDMEMDGYRAQSRVEGRQLNSTLRYDFDPGSNLQLAINYTDQPVSDDPGALTRAEVAMNPRAAAPAALTFDGGEALEQTRVGLAYNKSIGERHAFSVRNYYVWRDFVNALAFRAGGAVTIDRFFVGGGASYTNRATIAGKDNRLIVGVDIDHQDDDRRRFDNNFGVLGNLTFDQNETVESMGVFLQNELTLSDRWELTLGLRHDEIEFDVADRFISDGNDSGDLKLEETSPTFALLYRLSPGINVYTNISTSFETPTTAELANPTGGGGFNPALQPQLAKNYEVGVKGALGERSHFSLALFRVNVEDELIPFEIPGFPGRSFFRNAGESKRKGLEFGVATSPFQGLDLSLAYTDSDFTFSEFVDAAGNDFAGNKIPGLPDQLLHAQAEYRHPRGWFGAVEALRVSNVFVDNANTQKNDGYTLTNVRAGYAIDRGRWGWQVFGGASNLFDEEYNANVRINAAAGRYFEPGPGSNFYGGVGVKYRFGG